MPEHVSQLIQRICQVLLAPQHHYDSLVIAFGTDTLSFVVPCVATALGTNFNKCVIFVTGMTSWDDNLDGRQNLIDAIGIAVAGRYRGVMAISAGRILAPLNLRKMSHHALDPFRNVSLMPPSEFAKLSKVLNEFLGRGISVNRPFGASEIISVPPPIDIGQRYVGQPIRPVVALQVVYPGLMTDVLTNLTHHGIEHVILLCYAGGTACVEKGRYSLPAAVSELRQAGVAVYAVSQQIGVIEPEKYEVCKYLKGAGCLYVTRFTGETLYSVLLILAAILSNVDEVRATVEQIEQGG